MKRITIWERYNLKDPEEDIWKWEHNHISEGLILKSEPEPICEYQRRAWRNRKWRYSLAHLNRKCEVIKC